MLSLEEKLTGIDDREAVRAVKRLCRHKTASVRYMIVPTILASVCASLAATLFVLIVPSGGWYLHLGGVVCICALVGWSITQVFQIRQAKRFLPEILASLGRCTRCGYKILEVQDMRCPECGQSVAAKETEEREQNGLTDENGRS